MTKDTRTKDQLRGIIERQDAELERKQAEIDRKHRAQITAGRHATKTGEMYDDLHEKLTRYRDHLQTRREVMLSTAEQNEAIAQAGGPGARVSAETLGRTLELNYLDRLGVIIFNGGQP